MGEVISGSSRSGKRLILVADDEPDILELVRFRLERLGYQTARARDGEEALRMAGELRPDLCIVDVVMPKLDGPEVVRALRDAQDTATTPVLFLTATVEEKHEPRGFELGGDDYLRKPFDPADLEERVQALLGRRG